MSAPRKSWTESDVDLLLGGFRLRLVSESRKLLEHVTSVMVPPCETAGHLPGADWTVMVEEADEPDPDEVDAVFSDRPVVVLPYGGPQLAVVAAGDGTLRAMGHYRPEVATAVIEVDMAGRTTRVVLPAGDEMSIRWADWLVRVFFASRMLVSGWHMLHASAVAVNGSAVLFLAEQGGGKSTLAHRACTELGAAFLADDLVLLGPGRTVVGWPTRVSLPEELVTGTAAAGVGRRRIVFSPADYRALLNGERSSPVPLGAVVIVAPGADADAYAPAVERVDSLRYEETVALDIPAQRLHTSDLLGLTGGPRPAGRSVPLPRELLGGVPTACLRIGDLRTLPHVPVWEALSELLAPLAAS
ncbi:MULTISPECIES: hypothetical protein [Microbispora]|uniref:Serine kinase n=1 Tax=Microbispora bryophytorum subsp. camponoti TaxID=1677852 RepID=A0ABR8L5W5_9ACTN|nr:MULTISPECIES: hypothetical protein [Microbispora]MBD3146328.1 hypothetical protein [Microbispora camponoti]